MPDVMFKDGRPPLDLILLTTAAAIVYAGIWMYAGYPYDFIPSDDLRFMQQTDKVFALSGLERLGGIVRFNVPVLIILIAGCRSLAGLMGFDSNSVLLFLAVAGCALTMISVSILSYHLFPSRAAAFASALVFAVSSWPVTYMFFFEPVAVCGPILLGSFLCAVRAYESEEVDNRWLGSSGVLAVVACLTSNAAALLIIIQTALLYFLFAKGSGLSAVRSMRAYYLSAAVAAIPFWKSLVYMAFHVEENVFRNHFERLGECYIDEMPRHPVFTFQRIMEIYAPYLWAVFIGLSVVSVVVFWMRTRTHGHFGIGRRNAATDRLFRLRLGLLAAVWLTILLVEALPVMKIARSYYMVYPLMVALTVSGCFVLYKYIVGRFIYVRVPLILLGLGLLALSTAFNLGVAGETIYYKQSAPLILDSIYGVGVADVSILKEDPHGKYMRRWLEDFEIGQEDGVSEADLRGEPAGGGVKALIVGPTGPWSGRTLLKNGCLKDFDFDYRRYRYVVLPYFAFYPPFLMEEEIVQALYAASMVPDYRDEDGNIKLVFVR